MKYNTYLILQYWRYNRKQVIIIVGAIVLLVLSTMINLLSARTEVRRSYYNALHDYGAMDEGFCNVSADEIDKLKESKVVDEVGVTTIVGKIERDGQTVTLGYYNDTAAGDLMSYGLQDGTFPQKEDEIAIEESMLHQMNLTCEIGDMIEVSLALQDDKRIDNKQYKLVGIIDDYSYSEHRRNNDLTVTDDGEPYPYPDPFAIISKAEGEQYAVGYYNVNVTYVGGDEGKKLEQLFDKLDSSLQESLKPKYAPNYGRKNVLAMMADAIDGISSEDELEIKSGMSKSVTTRWMFILSLITALISVISIFSVVSTYMIQRKQSYRIFQMCGMKKSRINTMLLTEIFLFLLLGYVIGCGVGMLLYEIIIYVQYYYFGLEYLRGYVVERIVGAHTYPPYITAFLLAVFAVAVILVREIYVINRKKDKRNYFRKRKHVAPLKRVLNYYDQMGFKILSISIVLVSVTFGYAYLAASIDNLKGEYSSLFELEDDGTDIRNSGFDFMIYRNKQADSQKGANINLDTGISQEVIDSLSERTDVSDVQAVLTDLTTELLIDRTDDTLELREKIEQADFEQQERSACEEMGLSFSELWTRDFARYYEDFGLEEVSHYNMPVVACNEEMLELLGEYLIAGEIDKEEIESGRAVLLVENDLSFLKQPFEVGDYIKLMDRIPKEGINREQFIDKEIFMPQTPIYAKPKVCGVLSITDERLKNMLEVYGTSIYGVNIGANILTTRTGYTSWGFPQKNYDRVGVFAAKDADFDLLDKGVKNLIASEQKVTYISLNTQLKKVNKKITANVISYVFMLVLMLFIFLLGYANIISMQYVTSLKRYALLNSMGSPMKQIKNNFRLANLKSLVIGSVISFVVIQAIQAMLKFVVQFQGKLLSDESMEYNERMVIYTKLQEIFMLDYDIKSQSVMIVMLLLAMIICGMSFVVITICFSNNTKSVYRMMEENQF